MEHYGTFGTLQKSGRHAARELVSWLLWNSITSLCAVGAVHRGVTLIWELASRRYGIP